MILRNRAGDLIQTGLQGKGCVGGILRRFWERYQAYMEHGDSN